MNRGWSTWTREQGQDTHKQIYKKFDRAGLEVMEGECQRTAFPGSGGQSIAGHESGVIGCDWV